MNKRQTGADLFVIGADITAPEEHFLGVMRRRPFKVGKPLRHPSALMPINSDGLLHRGGHLEKATACGHRIVAQILRHPMAGDIEEADVGRRAHQRHCNGVAASR